MLKLSLSLLIVIFSFSIKPTVVHAWRFDTPLGEAKGDDPKPQPPPPSIPDIIEKVKEAVFGTVEEGKKVVSDGAEVAKSAISEADKEQKNAASSVSNELKKIAEPISVQSKQAFAPLTNVLSDIRKQLETSANDGKQFFSPLTSKTDEISDKLDNWWRNKSDNDNELKHQKKMIDDAEIAHANNIALWNNEINKQNYVRGRALAIVNDYSKIKLLKNSVQTTCKTTDSVSLIDLCIAAINELIDSENIFIKSWQQNIETLSKENQSLVDLCKKTLAVVDKDIKININDTIALKNKRNQKLSLYGSAADNISCQDRAFRAKQYLINVLQSLKNSMFRSDAWGVRVAKYNLRDYQKVKALLLSNCNLINKPELVQIENRIFLAYSSWSEDLWFKSSCQQYHQYSKFNNNLKNQSEMLSLCQRNVKSDPFISALSEELMQLRSRGGVR